MTDPASSRKHRFRWRTAIWVVAITAAAVVCTDYAAFHARKRRALAVVAELGGRAGSIGGWPIGEENAISFRRNLTDEELERLAILNTLGWRHHVSIGFYDCDLPDDRLAQIQAMLGNCDVYRYPDRSKPPSR